MEKNKYRKNAKAKNKKDGWINAITGLGTKQDKSFYTTFRGFQILSTKILSDIWIGDGFGKRIIEVIADDMTREWISINNDSENLIQNKLDFLDSQSNFNLALKWKRLFGGSIIIIGINDGRLIEEPVNIDAIKSIDFLKVFDRTNIALTNINFQDNIYSTDYGKIDFYTVTPSYGAPFNIHRSRVLEFKGIPVPSGAITSDFWYWGMSELQPIWNNLKDFGAGINNVSKILYEFIIGVYKLDNLVDLIAEGNEHKFRNRMNAIDLSKSMIQGIMLDTTEDYDRNSANVSGLSDILDRFMMFISGASGIPVTRLFGRSPAGQNSTGESDLINYYDMIVPKQNNEMKKQLQKLILYINNSQEIGQKKIKEPIITFNKLFQLSESEEIKNRKVQADIDNIYINNSTLDTEEVRKSRFKNGYSYETKLVDDEIEDEL